MASSRTAAPLYTDAYQLTQWVLNHFDDQTGALAVSVVKTTLNLLECITLALAHHDTELHVERADATLAWLRTQLRLIHECAMLDEQQLMHALERADTIGRQIGGWRKRLGPI